MASIRFLGAAGTVTGSRFRRTSLVHGEGPSLAAALARMERLDWPASVPRHLEEVAL